MEWLRSAGIREKPLGKKGGNDWIHCGTRKRTHVDTQRTSTLAGQGIMLKVQSQEPVVSMATKKRASARFFSSNA